MNVGVHVGFKPDREEVIGQVHGSTYGQKNEATKVWERAYFVKNSTRTHDD